MTNFLNVEPWWRFGVALLLGALIGLEREFIQQHNHSADFAGIRTFALIALLGAVSAFLSDQYGILPAIVAFGGLILLMVAGYVGTFFRSRKGPGITTEVAAILTFLLGAMVAWDQAEVGVALAVVTALLLSLKGSLHKVIRRMSVEDLRATLEFALVAAVVLPLLPNRTIDPLGVLNPSQVWLLVVLVSGIGFTGYVLMKLLGAKKGIGLTGLLGGVVSSTATTISFSTRSKETPELSSHYAQGVLIASCVMFPRVAILVLIGHPPLLAAVTAPLTTMLTAGLVMVFVLQRRQARRRSDEDEKAVDLANPLKLSTAITFGLVFAVVLLAVKLSQSFFGSIGVYIASAIAGLPDVNAITLSVAGLAKSGHITTQVAAGSIILASVANTLAKAAIAAFIGTPEMRRTVLAASGVVLLAGTISAIVMLTA